MINDSNSSRWRIQLIGNKIIQISLDHFLLLEKVVFLVLFVSSDSVTSIIFPSLSYLMVLFVDLWSLVLNSTDSPASNFILFYPCINFSYYLYPSPASLYITSFFFFIGFGIATLPILLLAPSASPYVVI